MSRENLMRNGVAVLCLLGSLGWAGSLGAVQANQEPASESKIRVRARLVLVDVIVTDKNGKLVTGLTQEDFRLRENGKRQTIASFDFEDADELASAAKSKNLPPNLYTNRPEYSAPPGQLTILLLDEINTPQRLQMQVRKQAQEFLRGHSTASHPTAVMVLGDRLRVLQNFTRDSKALEAAVEGYVPRQSSLMNQMQADLRLPTAISDLSPALRELSLQKNRTQAIYRANITDARVRRTAEAIEYVANTVAGYPGRKNLIWISSFFPMDIKPNRSELPRPDLRMGISRSYERRLRKMTGRLADAQLSLYTIDARGLDVPNAGETGGPVAGGRNIRDFGNRAQMPVEAAADSRDTLRVIAQQTGGRAFLNTNDIAGAIATGIEDGSRYYVLGFRPAGKGNDKDYRRLKVTMARKGLRVRHRLGYYLHPPESEKESSKNKQAPEKVWGALLPQGMGTTEVTFFARIHPPKDTPDKSVSVQFIVDGDTVEFKTGEDGRRALDLDFYVGVYSDHAKLVTESHRQVQAEFSTSGYERARTEGVTYPVELELEPGAYRFHLMVQDNATGKTGGLVIPYTIAEPAAD